MQLRRLAPQDAASYEELLRSLSPHDRYLRFFHTLKSIGPREVLPFVSENPNMIGFVAEEEGRALGAAHAFVDGDQAEIAIVVRPDVRHHGIGGALLQKLVETLRDRGIHRVVAHSLNENAEFAKIALEAHMHGDWEDCGTTGWHLDLGDGQ